MQGTILMIIDFTPSKTDGGGQLSIISFSFDKSQEASACEMYVLGLEREQSCLFLIESNRKVSQGSNTSFPLATVLLQYRRCPQLLFCEFTYSLN